MPEKVQTVSPTSRTLRFAAASVPIGSRVSEVLGVPLDRGSFLSSAAMDVHDGDSPKS